MIKNKSHRKYMPFQISIILFLILCFAGCMAKQSPTLKIGFIGGLTGKNSELGVSGRNGALLAINKINAQGGIDGKRLELVVVDDGNDPKAALSAIKDLHAQGINLVVGPFTSGMAVSILPFANEHGMLLLSPTVSTEALTAKDDNFLRVIPSNRLQAKLLASAAIEDYHTKKVYAVYDEANKAFAEEVYLWFSDYFSNYGGSVIASEAINTNENPDYEAVAKNIILSGADGLLCVSNGTDFAMISQELVKRNYTFKAYGPMWAMTGDLLANGGAAVEGAVFPGMQDFECPDLEYQKFQQEYLSKFGQLPTFSSVLAYETCFAVAQSFSESTANTDSVDRLQFIGKSFSSLQDESFIIDKNGDVLRVYQRFTVNGGKFVKE